VSDGMYITLHQVLSKKRQPGSNVTRCTSWKIDGCMQDLYLFENIIYAKADLSTAFIEDELQKVRSMIQS